MLSKDVLYRLYVIENKTTEEIAKIAGVQNAKTVTDWLRKCDIPRRKEVFTPPIDKDTLYDLYVNERLTTFDIGVILGMSNSTVANWLRKYEIPIRQTRDAQRPANPSREELYELYVNQEISINNIAIQLKSSEINISKLLKEYGIPIRSKTAKCAGWNKGIPLPAQQRDNLSAHAKQRIGEKSPRYRVTLDKTTRGKIANSLKGKYRQHLNPNWKNGGTTRYRRIIMGQYEYKEWRKAVYERDNYTCQMCQKPSNGDIQAHHIYPVKTHPERILDVNNGVTLCIPCHKSIHFKEEEYISQFEAIIHRSIQ